MTEHEYEKVEQDFEIHIPFIPVERRNEYQLGFGVKGRHFPASGQTDIVDSAHGDDFNEIYTHEAKHCKNPSSEEDEVRDSTRNLLRSTRWH